MITTVIDPQAEEERQILVPLKHVNIQGRIEAGHTTIDAQLSFVNLSEAD